jgi:flagellar basal-body rod protein FlgF
MDTSSYVALSGQVALEKRLSTIAFNIANARSTGFRASTVNFESVLSKTRAFETAFSSPGREGLDPRAGALKKTGNMLDLAVKGQAFLSVETPHGQVYSRDGRLNITPEGLLTNLEGHPVLDIGGGQITVDPRIATVDVAADGTVSQQGRALGQIGLFDLNLSDGYRRSGATGIVPKAEAQPVTSFANNGLVQGFLEDSNVNPVAEMANMIEVTRTFEALNALADKAQDAERNAIQILGGR